MDRHLAKHVEIPQLQNRRRRRFSLSVMLELRQSGMTYQQIADHKELGCTRQHVAHSIKRAELSDPKIAELNYAVAPSGNRYKPNPPPEKQLKARTFHVLVIRWLRESGYGYCWMCRSAQDRKNFSPSGMKTDFCRVCQTARNKKQYHENENIRAYVKAYAKTEKYKQYQRDYYAQRQRDKHALLPLGISCQ